MTQQPVPYLFPLDAESLREVMSKAAHRLAELVKPTEEKLVEDVPGVKRLRGRELLAWYTATDDQYWLALAAKYPDIAREAIIEWGHLITKYGAGVYEPLP